MIKVLECIPGEPFSATPVRDEIEHPPDLGVRRLDNEGRKAAYKARWQAGWHSCTPRSGPAIFLNQRTG